MMSAAASGASAPAVNESAREIPIAYDVDVLVVGGSTGAVAAASAAARAGSSVFLAAPRPYLGEDMAGTMRLWLEPGEEPEAPLARALYAASAAVGALPSVPFRYDADMKSSQPHLDDPDERVLSDGAVGEARTGSVQYDGDVTLTVDLSRARPLKRVHLAVFRRVGDFDVARVKVRTSADGETWTEAAELRPSKAPPSRDAAEDLSAPVTGEARYLKLAVERAEGCERVLVGEIAVEAADDGSPAAAEAIPQPPTPMHVKRALDQELLDAGVRFLYGCYVTDVLADAEGRPAGLVMANRAGRQAVLARTIIDATPRAAVARMAGAEFGPYPTGPQTFTRVVVGGEAAEGENFQVRRLPFSFASGRDRYEVFEYTLRLTMPDGSWASFAEAEQAARDATWHPGMVDDSERLFQVPPDVMTARAAMTGAWPGAAAADLEALRPAGVDGVRVLGGCAAVDRAAAASMLRPVELMALGTRVGVAAAAEARERGKVAGVRLAGSLAVDAAKGDVDEVLRGIRPVDTDRPTVEAEARSLPVLGTWDVVVVGGGTGGAPAGMGAARLGARTLVIEYLDGLGGVSTLGLIGKYYHGNRVGVTLEIDRGVQALGADVGVVGKSEFYRRAIREPGGTIWFSTMGVGVVVDEGTVRGVVVATPRGRGVVLAKTIIDATGNADIAAAAGAETDFVSGAHVAMQGTGLPGVDLGASYTNTDYTFADDADLLDAWRMFLVGREKFARAFDLGQILDTRERRRIVGDVVISPLDIINERTFPDTVVRTKSDFDSHGYTVHPVFLLRAPSRDGRDLYCNLPYRAMLPKGLDGILVTGLGTSAHRDAVPILRMQPDIQNQGYAAGVAGAFVRNSAATVRTLDIRDLQTHLVQVGNLPPNVLEAEDSYPLPKERVAEAVRHADESYRTMAVILAQPQTSVPLMRKAYAETRDEEMKRVYAHILGMMADATGAETLLEAVREADWDKGWNFRGMGQYGASLSTLDSWIIALGRTGEPRAVPVILEKIKPLSAESEFSHHRAVGAALEILRPKEAAEPLAALLAEPGMRGHAVLADDPTKRPGGFRRNAALRELVLARALYRCGDHEGLGEAILRTYARDVRGVFARHATAVLEGP